MGSITPSEQRAIAKRMEHVCTEINCILKCIGNLPDCYKSADLIQCGEAFSKMLNEEARIIKSDADMVDNLHGPIGGNPRVY